MLPAPTVIAVASVHKYWTSAFVKTADNTELIELLKLVEMYTSRSHVLNCELYKVQAMEVDELHSTVENAEDIDALRSENKGHPCVACIRVQLAVTEDARARVVYDITKSRTIQGMCAQAQRKAESQLRACQNIGPRQR
ncbi:hypothetical protein Fot_41637 [Forsythia ovata]|uniref:Uncharacterized protein n=1 Tax=Forsythia ovata TaxID=205694 RepID=A0ABD1RIW4_9LAMI